MKLTIFDAVPYTFGKLCKSRYNDNTFVFSNTKDLDLFDAYRTICSNFTCALDYDIKSPIRTFRRNENLSQFLKFQKKVFLDIDCNSQENLNKILNYFKDFTCVLGESSGYNGINNFNLKGLLEIEPSNFKEYLDIFKQIQTDLEPFGYLDDKITLTSHYIFPLTKHKILLENVGQKYSKYPKVNFKSSITLPDFDLKSHTKTKMCLEYFKCFGFTKTGKNQFEKDGLKYYFNPEFPTYMRCEIRSKSISIKEPIAKFQSSKISETLVKFSPELELNERFLSPNKIQTILNDFLKIQNSALCIKSYMGSGKSEIIKSLIQKSKKPVLIITPRVTLAIEFNNKFKIPVYFNVNFDKTSTYQKIDYRKGMSLICQYDSLNKIKDFSSFGAIILDEFCSVLCHSIDNLSAESYALLEKFLKLLKFKKLVISDAFLCDYVLKLISHEKKFLIENHYKEKIKIKQHLNRKEFFKDLKSRLENGEKITISTTSLNIVERYLKVICSSIDKSFCVIHGKNTDTRKKETVLDFNSEKLNYDCIVFSPLVTIGISIFNDISTHFHYDGGFSTSTIPSIQMLGRARKVKEIVYFVKELETYTDLGIENDILWETEHISSNTSKYFTLNDDLQNELKPGIGEYWMSVRKYQKFLKRNTRKSFNLLLSQNFLIEN